jgi:intracellular multiplication protein IcmP
MAGAAQQPNQETATNFLWILAAFFFVVLLIWFFFKNQLVSVFFTIKLYELKLYSMTKLADPVLVDRLESIISSVIAAPEKVKFEYLVNLGNRVGEVVRYFFVALPIIFAVIVYFGSSTRVYKRIYTMAELAKLEKVNWPQITPVIGLNLLKQDIDTGPWAMALSPMQFCKRHKLLEEVKVQRQEGMSRKDWNKIEVSLKRGDATMLFVMQLGQLFRGTNQLPLHTRALFAIFAARINADSKPAEKLLAQFAATSIGTVNYDGVDELLKKHENTKLVQQVLASHAYVFTVMAAMLERARDDGVQASSDFLWIKPIDRQLWYTLNTVGRQTPFVEVAGVFAHWVSEKDAGIKLVTPMITEAVNALEQALKELVYRPDDETQR